MTHKGVMAYAICNTHKIKTPAGIVSRIGHNVREDGHVQPNHDPERKGLNRELVSCGGDPLARWAEIVGENGGRAVKGNAVRAVEVLMTISPETIDEDPDFDLEKWISDNENWFLDKFGRENVISLHYHGDERTPHLQGVVVPMVDGRLCCREILGGRQKCQKLQDDYWERVGKPHGLKRGEKGSGAREVKTREYLRKVGAAIEHGEEYLEEQLRAFEKTLGRGISGKARKKALSELSESLRPVFVKLGELALRVDEAEDLKDREKRKAEELRKRVEELEKYDVRELSQQKLTEILCVREAKIRELERQQEEERKPSPPNEQPKAAEKTIEPEARTKKEPSKER